MFELLLTKFFKIFFPNFKPNNYVEPSSIMVRLAPHFPPPSPSPDQPASLTAMLARESPIPSASPDSLASGSNTVVQTDPPEVVFLTRSDQRRDSRPESRQPQADRREPVRHESDRREYRPAPPLDRPRSSGTSSSDFHRRDASPPSDISLASLQACMGDLQSDLAQLVRRAKHADTSKSSRRARSATYLATDMPSSYGDDDSAHALGAIHIDPDLWTPNLSRDAVYDSDE
jgi:hypothetical protein